jgi:hypothetical protein
LGARADAEEPRSGFGAVPGSEFPSYVYASVLAAFAWIMIAAWLAFARAMDANLALSFAIVLGLVFFALPIIIRHVARAFVQPKPQAPREFLASPVETGSGTQSGASAWFEVLIIPLALALAATLIGAAFLLAR